MAAIDYAVVGGTATEGEDYETLGSGTLTFGVGESIKTIELVINGDNAFEGDESIIITLSNPTGNDVVLGHYKFHTHTIENDD